MFNFPQFDTDLLLLVNQSNNMILDNVMAKFSETITWMPLLLVVMFVILRDRPIKEALLIFAGMILCIVMADQISASFIKPWVCRYRPTHDPEIMFQIRHITGRGGGFSFVSSHAANTFAMATFLSLVFRHRLTTICMLTWASIVGFSRIYLGMHFPLDVLCGGLLGVGIGYFLNLLYCILKIRLLGIAQQFYSSAYTSSGFLRDDMYLVLTIMALTFAYTIF